MADAVYKITDGYDPLVFRQMTQEAMIEKNAFIQSGVAVPDEELDTITGSLGEVTRFAQITTDEANVSSDDNTSSVEVQKIATNKQIVRRFDLNKHYSAMSLARSRTLGDPVQALTDQFGGYAAFNSQTRLIKAFMGIKADNIANDSSDMLHSPGNDVDAAVADAERLTSTTFLTAIDTLGDAKGMVSACAMHSKLHTRLQLQGALQDHFDLQTGVLLFQSFLGYRVIVDDALAPVAGTYRDLYTVIIFGNGAVGYRDITLPANEAFELYRLPGTGDGGGETRLAFRWAGIHHPRGFSYVGTPSGKSSTWAELATASHWNRIAPRKLIPVAYLEVND